MGKDVVGMDPSSAIGEYFAVNNACWHCLGCGSSRAAAKLRRSTEFHEAGSDADARVRRAMTPACG